MQLESGPLSDESVKVMAANFVAVKIDPRERFDAREHKTTRYVPELVILDPSQNFITSVQSRDAQGIAREMEEALAESTRRKNRR